MFTANHRDAGFVCGGERFVVLPVLLAAPTDVIAPNFFFDTLLFCGAILLLANTIDKMQSKVGTLLIANRKIAGLTPSDSPLGIRG